MSLSSEKYLGGVHRVYSQPQRVSTQRTLATTRAFNQKTTTTTPSLESSLRRLMTGNHQHCMIGYSDRAEALKLWACLKL